MASHTMGRTRRINASDTVPVYMGCDFIMAGVAGTVAYTSQDGDAPGETEIIDVPANVWMPVGNCKFILATGTTATSLQVF